MNPTHQPAVVRLDRRNWNKEIHDTRTLRRIAKVAWRKYGNDAIIIVIARASVFYVVFPPNAHVGAHFHEDRSARGRIGNLKDTGHELWTVLEVDDPNAKFIVAFGEPCKPGETPRWHELYEHSFRDSFDMVGNHPHEVLNASKGIMIVEFAARPGERVDTHVRGDLEGAERNSIPVTNCPAIEAMLANAGAPAAAC